MRPTLRLLPFALVLFAPLASARPARVEPRSAPMHLFVDATEAPRGILHARLEIPARPGPLTLVYPKWIPGEHAPSGPLVNMAGFTLSAGGKPLAWERDPVDLDAFHCRVPAGATTVDATLDYLLPVEGGRFSAGVSSTSQLLVLEWNEVLVYPLGRRLDELPVAARLVLPPGWSFGTALPVAQKSTDRVEFATVPLGTLVDSPVAAGAHVRSIPLGREGGPPVVADLVCDSEAGLAASAATVAEWRTLVAEAEALFGAHHYARYHFLVSLSDHIAHFGLEHHESSDDRMVEGAVTEPSLVVARSGLLPHEYVHSWNGKYRRPADLTTPDYQKPMQTSMLWVYEGLTTYLGFVLRARSGLASDVLSRDYLAQNAAWLDRQPGRAWRSLQDDALSTPILNGAPEGWGSWRRGRDFYPEGMLIWLEADVRIRQKTGGKRSLDDFCRAFYGGASGAPAIVPYTFDELVKALDQISHDDWRTFFRTRLDSHGPRAPLGGVEGSGWRLVWSDSLTSYQRSDELAGGNADLRFSLGLLLGKEGALLDVVPGSPAALAGIGPGMKLIGVDGRRFSVPRLRQALRAGRNGTRPLELLVENDDYFQTCALDWHGGELYPRLERDPAKPDLLGSILAPRTPAVAPEKDGE